MNLKAFSFVEVLVGISLLLIIFLALYGAFQLGLKTVGQSKASISAIALANQKMEEIRNLPYDSVGTSGGIPAGALAETEIIERNGLTFTVKTTVLYIDDEFDGLAPADAVPADYKRAKVKVSWSGYFGGQVGLATDISPYGVETEAGGGTLKISVFDASGIVVSGAAIHLENSQVLPAIDAYYETNEYGVLIIAGAPTSTDGYEITVGKETFSEDRTYGQDEITSPLKPHASVFQGRVTEVSFLIDRLSSLFVETRSRSGFDDEFSSYQKISQYENIVVSSGEVNLQQSAGGYESEGFLISETVSPPNLFNWSGFSFSDEEPEFTEITYFVFYFATSSWELVPNEDLPGNSLGFLISPVSLSGLNVADYPGLRLKAVLKTNSSSLTPRLFDWHLYYNTPLLPNTEFSAAGAKIIGTDEQGDEVKKYQEEHSSDSSGSLLLSGLEWDSYEFYSVTSTAMDLIDIEPPPQPMVLLPWVIDNLILYFKAENTLLAKIRDASTTEPVFGANVRLFSFPLSYDQNLPTDENGQTFFLPLKNGEYNYEVYQELYQFATGTVSVSGDAVKIINLTQ